jgi:hypothetical protein
MHIRKTTTLGVDDRRNFVGFWPYSDNQANHEYAGISISDAKGLHAEIREYAAASATVKKDDRYSTFPLSTLTGRFHHVHVEVRFARDTTGYLRVEVDGVVVAQIMNVVSRTNSSYADKFVFWIGANANPYTPAFSVRYDNVEVRTR